MPRARCSVQGCERLCFGHGFCNAHYKRWRKTGDPGTAEVRQERGVCRVVDCTRPHRARGLCATHYKRWSETGEVPTTPIHSKEFKKVAGPCLRAGCVERSRGSGYCDRHYSRLRLLVSYGLDGYTEFDRLWKRCGGKCSICRTPLDSDGKNTHVDHCHESSRVRGLLCGNCNRGLGMFGHDPYRLGRAIKYLAA